MNITIAIDSLKGSLSSIEAGRAIKNGIRKVYPDAKVSIRPVADGGEGTVDALVEGMNGQIHQISVTGPLGQPVTAKYGIISRTNTAVMEMSQAAGITLVPEEKRNPLYTTTYGVGEMIKDAIQKNCRHFIIGIGGSATNDGGIGMLQALGYDFLDSDGLPVPLGAIGLKDLASISCDNVIPALKECTFRIACDVTNVLCGKNGCSAVFGPQKGATDNMIAQMDAWLHHYASLAQNVSPQADPSCPGTGAAGGLGFAFLTFTNAVLESGVKIILEETLLEDYIKTADYVITGEGCLDRQTVMEKAPIGVAKLAKQFGKPVLAFSGSATRDASLCNENGIDAFFPILCSVVSLEEAMNPKTAAQNMSDTAEQVFRLIRLKG